MRCVNKNYGTLNAVDMLLRKLHITEFWNTLMMLIVRVQVRFCQKFPVKTSKPRDSLSTLENAQDTDAQLMGYMDEEKERLVTWA